MQQLFGSSCHSSSRELIPSNAALQCNQSCIIIVYYCKYYVVSKLFNFIFWCCHCGPISLKLSPSSLFFLLEYIFIWQHIWLNIFLKSRERRETKLRLSGVSVEPAVNGQPVKSVTPGSWEEPLGEQVAESSPEDLRARPRVSDTI